MLEFIAETGSTNADLAARLRAGEQLREGHWLIADRQTAGHGRMGREWQDGAGNFMGSTLVRPGYGDPAVPSLALLAGLALYQTAIELCGGSDGFHLKWPNDLMQGAAKVAGILLESQDGVIVVGIGVNLVSAPVIAGRETASLCAAQPVSRDQFAELLAKSFDAELERWRSAGVAPLIRRWQQAGHPVGTPIDVQEPGGARISGHYAGLDDTGALQLRRGDGTVSTIHAGDVLFPQS